MNTLTTNGLLQKLQGVIDDVNAMHSLEITDGWVPANQELFRVFVKSQHAIVLQAERNGMTVEEISEGLGLPTDKVIDLLTQPLELPLEVGVMVRSKHPNTNPLRSGAECYPGAIVVSVKPFVMVSFEGDMRWSTWKPEDVETVKRAPEHMLAVAMRRLDS